MNSAIDTQSSGTTWLAPVQVEAAEAISFEPFVDEHVVARFLQISERRVLEMARRSEIPAHPLGHSRKTWRFRMSEIDAHFSTPAPARNFGATMSTAVPGTQESKQKATR